MNRAKAKRPAKKATIGEQIEQQRQRLFQAHGVVQVTRYAVASQLNGLDESAVLNALQVAGELVDGVATVLDTVNLNRHQLQE